MKIWITKKPHYNVMLEGYDSLLVWFNTKPWFNRECDEWQEYHDHYSGKKLSKKVFDAEYLEMLRQNPKSHFTNGFFPGIPFTKAFGKPDDEVFVKLVWLEVVNSEHEDKLWADRYWLSNQNLVTYESKITWDKFLLEIDLNLLDGNHKISLVEPKREILKLIDFDF